MTEVEHQERRRRSATIMAYAGALLLTLWAFFINVATRNSAEDFNALFCASSALFLVAAVWHQISLLARLMAVPFMLASAWTAFDAGTRILL